MKYNIRYFVELSIEAENATEAKEKAIDLIDFTDISDNITINEEN